MDPSEWIVVASAVAAIVWVKYLPAFQETAVDIVPDRPGRFGFTCGMGMLHGTLVVER